MAALLNLKDNVIKEAYKILDKLRSIEESSNGLKKARGLCQARAAAVLSIACNNQSYNNKTHKDFYKLINPTKGSSSDQNLNNSERLFSQTLKRIKALLKQEIVNTDLKMVDSEGQKLVISLAKVKDPYIIAERGCIELKKSPEITRMATTIAKNIQQSQIMEGNGIATIAALSILLAIQYSTGSKPDKSESDAICKAIVLNPATLKDNYKKFAGSFPTFLKNLSGFEKSELSKN